MRKPALVQGQHVGVALHYVYPALLRGVLAGAVDAEQRAALAVNGALGGVHVLGLLVVAHRARAEAEHPPAGVPQREHDPRAEAVVEAAPPALAQARRLDLRLREPRPPRAQQHAVPGAGRKSHAELLQHLAPEATALEVGAGPRRLAGVPQVPAVEGGRLREQLDQPLALAPALVVAPAGVVLQLDSVAVGELLDGVAEVEALLLLQEREDVAARLAAEAVVELLDRVDRERRRALVVERAQPEPPRAPAGAARCGRRRPRPCRPPPAPARSTRR